MQQHSSGQPPEKKIRVTGNYASGDPTNYDYQVNKFIDRFLLLTKFPLLAKSKSTATTTTDVSAATAATFLVCSSFYMYI